MAEQWKHKRQGDVVRADRIRKPFNWSSDVNDTARLYSCFVPEKHDRQTNMANNTRLPTHQKAVVQDGRKYQDCLFWGEYKNEQMKGLSKALAVNNLDAVDDPVSQFVASDPASGIYARAVNSLAPIMQDAVAVDNSAFAEKLLRRGLVLHDSYVRTALGPCAMRCLALFLQRGLGLNKPESESRLPVWGSSMATANRDIVYWLLDHGADLTVDTEWINTTPVASVVQHAAPDPVRGLLEGPRHFVDTHKGDLLHDALDCAVDVDVDTDTVGILGLVDHGAPIYEALYARRLGA
jgi:hypothetical protein